MENHDSFVPPKWMITIAVLAVAFWLVYELKELVTLVLAGYCIAYLLHPVIDRLEDRRIPRTAGTLLTFIVLLVVAVIFFATAIPTFIEDYRSLSERLPEYKEQLWNYADGIVDNIRRTFNLPVEFALPTSFTEILGMVDMGWINKIFSGAGQALLHGYSITLTVLNLVLLPFIAFYICVDFHEIHRKMLDLIPLRYRSKVTNVAHESNWYVAAFIRGQLLVGLILACLYGLGLGVIGVELWFLLAVISGFGNIVPYLGFMVGITLSLLMSMLTFGDTGHVLYVFALFMVVQALESFIITPKILGDKVGISPLVIIIVIIAAGKLFGFLGIFLAVPATAVLRVLGRHFYSWVIESQKTPTAV